MPPSRVKPSQRERKRYILARVDTDGHLPPRFDKALRDEIRRRLGLLDAAKATVLTTYTWHDTGHVILRVAHTYADDLIDHATRIDDLAGQPVTVKTQTTSGTVKRVKDHYRQHCQQ